MSSSPRQQTVRNAWINLIRDEALRARRPEVCKAAGVGVWIATYADADGSNAFPSAETLSKIVGCTDETVTRCVRLLIAVGLLQRKRRPNQSAVYQLVMPFERPDWDAHMHVWGESRQARARRLQKEREMAEFLAERQPRNPSADGNRNPSADGGQDPSEPVPGGGPEPVRGGKPTPPGTRPRTPPEPVPGRVPDTVPGGGDQYPLPKGRDPQLDHDVPGFPTQPDSRAGAREANDDPPGQHEPPAAAPAAVARCAACGHPLLPDPRRPGRDRHTHCTAQAAGGDAA
ncbi:hypothetical protein DMB38_12950 [Streptomyces sp. WAC 06738]|nr:hypothetical protein DMB38_12950 [Streptomyces sp. WAC 06738]